MLSWQVVESAGRKAIPMNLLPCEMMRGADTFTENLFTLRKLEDFVPADHPLRSIRTMTNAVLAFILEKRDA